MMSETRKEKAALTFVLLRRPFVPSIHMYSASTLPFWSNFMYLANWWTKSDLFDTSGTVVGAEAQEGHSRWRRWTRWSIHRRRPGIRSVSVDGGGLCDARGGKERWDSP